MTEAEKLLRRCGAIEKPCRDHLVFELRGERFTIKRGKKPNHREITKVRMKLRRLGLIP